MEEKLLKWKQRHNETQHRQHVDVEFTVFYKALVFCIAGGTNIVKCTVSECSVNSAVQCSAATLQ